MSQPIQTKSTRRSNKNKSTTAFSFLKAKTSNIPVPVQTEDPTYDIVNWGVRNEYPYFLNYLATANPIHSGILKSKTYYTVSGGLQYEGTDQELWKSFYNNKKNTPNEKNLDDLQNDISYNFEKSNMFCYRMIFTQIGLKEFRKLVEIPFEKIRYEIDETEEGAVFLTGNIKISDNWLDDQIPIEILGEYDPVNDKQRECFVLHQEESGASLDRPDSREVNAGIYPDPTYAGGITAIDTGIEVGVHGNSEIHNGFSLGTILNLNNGAPKNDDAKRDLERDLGSSTTGSYQAGRMMVLYNNGKDNASTVTNLNGNDLPDRYMNTKTGAEESIIHAHSVTTPILFGIKTEGSLGNATELEVGYSIMQANYFTARRTALLSVLNWIGKKVVGLEGEITFGEVALKLESNVEDEGNKIAAAINSMSPLVATKVLAAMTPNEVRGLGKLAPKEGGDDLPTTGVVLSKQDADVILNRFKEHGTNKSEFNILHKQALIDGTEAGESKFMDEFKNSFAKLSDDTQRALELINDGQDFNSIRKALDITGTALAAIYATLLAASMINKLGAVSDIGLQQIAVNQVESMTIMYEYELRGDAPALLPGGRSRDFCATLMGLGRLYTREEINLISGVEGYDVFAYRGGWYHDPNLDVNQPGCRHQWSQVVTFGLK